MSTQQPEALRLAELLDGPNYATIFQLDKAADELRRLHSANTELLNLLTHFMPLIESEKDDKRQAPWVERVRAAAAIGKAMK